MGLCTQIYEWFIWNTFSRFYGCFVCVGYLATRLIPLYLSFSFRLYNGPLLLHSRNPYVFAMYNISIYPYLYN